MPTNNRGSAVPKRDLILPDTIDYSKINAHIGVIDNYSHLHSSKAQPVERQIFDIQTALKKFKPNKKNNATAQKDLQEDSVDKLTFDDSHLQDSLTVKYENEAERECQTPNSVQNSLFKLKDDASVGRYLSQQISSDIVIQPVSHISSFNDMDLLNIDDEDEDMYENDVKFFDNASPTNKTAYRFELRFNNLSQWKAESLDPRVVSLRYKLVEDIMVRESQLMKLRFLVQHLDAKYWQYCILRIKKSTEHLLAGHNKADDADDQRSVASDVVNSKALVAKRNRILLLQSELGVAVALYRDVSMSILEGVSRLRVLFSKEFRTSSSVSVFWNEDNYILKMSRDMSLFESTLTVRMWLGFKQYSPLLLPPTEYSDASIKEKQELNSALFRDWMARHKDKVIRDRVKSSGAYRARVTNNLIVSERRFILENLRLSTPPDKDGNPSSSSRRNSRNSQSGERRAVSRKGSPRDDPVSEATIDSCDTSTVVTTATMTPRAHTNELSLALDNAVAEHCQQVNKHAHSPRGNHITFNDNHQTDHSAPAPHLEVIYSTTNLKQLAYPHNALYPQQPQFSHNYNILLEEWQQLRDYSHYSWQFNSVTGEYEQHHREGTADVSAEHSVDSFTEALQQQQQNPTSVTSSSAFWNNFDHNPLVVEAAIGFAECFPAICIIPALPDTLFAQCVKCEDIIRKETSSVEDLSQHRIECSMLKSVVESVAHSESVSRIGDASLLQCSAADNEPSELMLESERLKLRQQGNSEMLRGISVDALSRSMVLNDVDFSSSLVASKSLANFHAPTDDLPSNAFLTDVHQQSGTSFYTTMKDGGMDANDANEASQLQIYGKYINLLEFKQFRVETSARIKAQITAKVDDERRIVEYNTNKRNKFVPTIRTDLYGRKKERDRLDPSWLPFNAMQIQRRWRGVLGRRKVSKKKALKRFHSLVMLIQCLMRGFLGRIRAKKALRKMRLECFLLRKATMKKLRAAALITQCVRRFIIRKREHAGEYVRSVNARITRKKEKKRYRTSKKPTIERQSSSRGSFGSLSVNSDGESDSRSTSPNRLSTAERSLATTPNTPAALSRTASIGRLQTPQQQESIRKLPLLVSDDSFNDNGSLSSAISNITPAFPHIFLPVNAGANNGSVTNRSTMTAGSRNDRNDDNSTVMSTGNNSLTSLGREKQLAKRNNKHKTELLMVASDAEKMLLNAKMEALALVARVNKGKVRQDTIYNSRLIPMKQVANLGPRHVVRKFSTKEHAFLDPNNQYRDNNVIGGVPQHSTASMSQSHQQSVVNSTANSAMNSARNTAPSTAVHTTLNTANNSHNNSFYALSAASEHSTTSSLNFPLALSSSLHSMTAAQLQPPIQPKVEKALPYSMASIYQGPMPNHMRKTSVAVNNKQLSDKPTSSGTDKGAINKKMSVSESAPNLTSAVGIALAALHQSNMFNETADEAKATLPPSQSGGRSVPLIRQSTGAVPALLQKSSSFINETTAANTVSNAGGKVRGGLTQTSMNSHASGFSAHSRGSGAPKLSHTEKLEAKARLKSELETLHMKNVLRNYF